MKGIIGKKIGMTSIFESNGKQTACTIIEAGPCVVTQVKSQDTDGYTAIQVAYGDKKEKHATKAETNHFAKASTSPKRFVKEFRNPDVQKALGETITCEIFAEGEKVDVVGTSKGKGFQGTIKRWNFRGQDNTHGNSVSHRVPGSIGQCQTPGRVFKGKKMSGHMGAERVTVQSLEVVRVDAERNLLLVKGAVPGATGGNLVVRPAAKARG